MPSSSTDPGLEGADLVPPPQFASPTGACWWCWPGSRGLGGLDVQAAPAPPYAPPSSSVNFTRCPRFLRHGWCPADRIWCALRRQAPAWRSDGGYWRCGCRPTVRWSSTLGTAAVAAARFRPPCRALDMGRFGGVLGENLARLLPVPTTMAPPVIVYLGGGIVDMRSW